MTTLTIKKLDESDRNALYCKYEGQINRQPVYIELDCEDGEMTADYSSEIGNGVPEPVWNGRALRYNFQAVPTTAAANRIMEYIAVFAQQVLDGYNSEYNDQTNLIGSLSDKAQEASDLIERIVGEPLDENDAVEAWDAAVWLQDFVIEYDDRVVIDGIGTITNDTTDDELAAMRNTIKSRAENVILYDITKYLDDLRSSI